MKRANLAVMTLTAALGGHVGVVHAQAPDPIAGVWRLNVAKSTLPPGTAPRKEIRTFESIPNGVKYKAEGLDASGKPFLRTYTAKYDGTDYPTSGHPTVDAIALKRLDDHTFHGVLKKDDKVVTTYTRVVARDGRTWVLLSDNIDASGTTVSTMLVFERLDRPR